MQFINLKAQQQRIKENLDAAIQRVLDHGQYILGPEVEAVERELADYCGVKHALTCASGTDAIIMALLAKDVKANDAILIPSYTFAATAGAVIWAGATPVFIDCLEDTYNIDPDSIVEGIATALKHGLRPAGIITVDLFGQPADYDQIQDIAEEHGMWVMADAAQSFGATYKGRHVGNIVDLSTTSFFPAKPLGCYGDGGAIFTNDDMIVEKMKSIRVHGHGTNDPTQYVRLGINGRFDTLQAAILLEKLKIFPDELQARENLAQAYSKSLQHVVATPTVLKDSTSAWAQYTVRLPNYVDREQMMADLKDAGIPSVIYYPRPLHKQPYYAKYLTATESSLPVCESLVKHVLSLPMSAYVTEQETKRVITAVCDVIESYDFAVAEIL